MKKDLGIHCGEWRNKYVNLGSIFILNKFMRPIIERGNDSHDFSRF